MKEVFHIAMDMSTIHCSILVQPLVSYENLYDVSIFFLRIYGILVHLILAENMEHVLSGGVGCTNWAGRLHCEAF